MTVILRMGDRTVEESVSRVLQRMGLAIFHQTSTDMDSMNQGRNYCPCQATLSSLTIWNSLMHSLILPLCEVETALAHVTDTGSAQPHSR